MKLGKVFEAKMNEFFHVLAESAVPEIFYDEEGNIDLLATAAFSNADLEFGTGWWLL